MDSMVIACLTTAIFEFVSKFVYSLYYLSFLFVCLSVCSVQILQPNLNLLPVIQSS